MRKVAIWLLLIFVWMSGFVAAKAFARESIDQYLDRMRMRRDSQSFRECLEKVKSIKQEGGEDVSACVPPDYNTQQEAWFSGEWEGTEK